eukprot:CAMPEP_0198141434 /NCGR_PEP_ID=MMETSP1443-20131203/4435_1 /TAXON_ID=186043 /ORGANISM="Entomoneis sp., Strain CCMP2396" /LENGTH=369 /DNA_ID=CAMNT_0043804183 /DNA_START=45 /DNA_END=1154 /DNA_ORIENTATION=+
MQKPERISWKDSNLALIGSDLDHKIKAAAAGGETAWEGLGESALTKVWRIEQFNVTAWPEENYGKFHTGDSYIVLNSYIKDGSDALLHDIHMWIGKESSQDEYGTAAYKMVELDEFLGGAPVQHREVQGGESPLFLSYFGNMTYLDGGADTGFRHVEPSKDEPHLYKIKGTEKGMSMSQVPLSKSSLNQGDCFILFANSSMVWVWFGESANPDEKSKANSAGEDMCTEGTVVLVESEGDSAEFWAYLGEGEIQAVEGGDEEIKAYTPVLYKIAGDGSIDKVAEGEPSKVRWGPRTSKLDRAALDESDVFLLDAGFSVFLWMGKSSDKSEKMSGMLIAEKYMQSNSRVADLPLSIVKSGWESSDFNEFFQ